MGQVCFMIIYIQLTISIFIFSPNIRKYESQDDYFNFNRIFVFLLILKQYHKTQKVHHLQNPKNCPWSCIRLNLPLSFFGAPSNPINQISIFINENIIISCYYILFVYTNFYKYRKYIFMSSMKKIL